MLKLIKLRSLTGILAVLCVVVIAAAACGGKEEPAAGGADKGKAAGKAQGKTAKSDKGAKPEGAEGVAASAGAPASVKVLQLMPESAAIAAAVPSAQFYIDKGIDLAKRLAPEGVDIDMMVQDTVAGMAEDAGVSDAESFADIATAKGIDLDGPMAFFMEVDTLAAKLDEAAAKLEEQASVGGTTAPTETEQQQGGSGTSSSGSTADAEKAQQELMMKQAEQVQQLMAEVGAPGIVGVMTCVDVDKAETTLKEILASEGSPLAGAEPEEIKAGDVTIHCYDTELFSYFVSDNLIAGGNSVNLLMETAARLGEPADIKYGTNACPATNPDEIVELVHLDKIMPMAESLIPVMQAMSPTPANAAILEAQSKMMEQAMAAYSGTDPAVATFAWEENKMEFLSRLDIEEHAALKAMTGPAEPLRLAPLLPEETQLFFAMRFNEEMKTHLQTNVLGALPSSVVPQQVSAMGPQLLSMIEDEVVVGVPGMAGIIPKLVVLMGLSNCRQTQDLLSLFMPMTEVEVYNDVSIKTANIPMPIVLNFAFIPDEPAAEGQPSPGLMLISTHADILKGIIDLYKAGETSGLFETLEPPIDVTTPKYSCFVMQTSLISQILPQVQAMASQVPPEAMMVVEGITDIIRELRMEQELVDGWLKGRLTILLSPEDAAPQAEPATGAATGDKPAAKK